MEPLPPIVIAGPVIIENGKVLLIREIKLFGISDWFFPGGTMEPFDESPEAACKREVKEELGLDIQIARELSSISFNQKEREIILHHYLATRQGDVVPGKDIAAWDWHDCRHLPENTAPNVRQIIHEYLATL